MIKVKICGLRSLNDVELMNLYLPDFAGFVFAPSKRWIDMETAQVMKEKLDAKIKTTGVFVNETQEKIAELCNRNIIDFIQLHGDESDEYIKILKTMVVNPIIKAVRLRNSDTILYANTLPCDYLLFDAYSSKEYGGTGKAFDWDILKTTSINKPFFLAGGLSAKNIAEAMQIQPRPFCIDISSGLEKGGVKDNTLVEEFMNLYRNLANKE